MLSPLWLQLRPVARRQWPKGTYPHLCLQSEFFNFNEEYTSSSKLHSGWLRSCLPCVPYQEWSTLLNWSTQEWHWKPTHAENSQRSRIWCQPSAEQEEGFGVHQIFQDRKHDARHLHRAGRSLPCLVHIILSYWPTYVTCVWRHSMPTFFYAIRISYTCTNSILSCHISRCCMFLVHCS